MQRGKRQSESGTRRRFIALGVFILSLVVSISQAQESIESSETGSLIHSAKLARNRSAQTRYDGVWLAAESGELVQAVDLIRELLESGDGTWILIRATTSRDNVARDEFWLSGPAAARRLLDRLGPSGFRLFREQRQAEAAAALRNATGSGDSRLLRETAIRFRPMREGLAALRFLAAQSLDRGHHQAAAVAFRQILQHPLSLKSERDSARRGLDSAQAGQTEVATVTLEVPADARPDIAKLVPFRGEPLWELPVIFSDETANAIADAMHEHTQQSIPRVLRQRPVVADDSVLIRSGGRLQRVGTETGEIQWEHSSSTSASSAGAQITNNLSMQTLMARNLAKELQIDSVTSTIHARGRSVLYVETSPRKTEVPSQAAGGIAIRLRAVGPFNNRVVVPAQNRIVHCDLESGQTNWVFAGQGFFNDEATESAGSEDESVFFLGPPTEVDELYYGMAQVGQSIRLYALQGDGQLVWHASVCETARELQQNVDWRFLACPVVPVGGVLLCPTSAGIVVAFDPVTRTPIWARRYVRDDVVEMSDILIKRQGASVSRQWWRCWRELAVSPASVNSQPHAVLASPDRRGLTLINLQTGEEVWHREVDDPLTLIAVTNQHAIVAEHRCLRAFQLTSGEPAWRVDVPEIAGSGYVSTLPGEEARGETENNYYVFPTQDRRLNAVRLSDGQITRTSVDDARPAGNLVRAGNVVIEQTADRITAWRILDACLSEESNGKIKPATVANAAATAGRFETAAARWRAILAPGAESPLTKSARRQAEQQLWQTLTHWLAVTPASRNVIEPQLRELAQDVDIRREIELTHVLARACSAADEPVAALDRFFQTLNLNPAGDEPVYSDGPLRMVRLDRRVQGELLDLIPDESASAEIRAGLRSRFAEQLQQARSSPDPFAAQRLAALLSAHPWAATLRLDEKSEVGRTFLEKQISLLQLSESDAAAVAAPAIERLAELYRDRSHELDATASTLRLLNRLENSSATDARNYLSRPDDIPDRGTLLQQLEQSDWDGLTPSVEIETASTPASSYVPVPIECEAGSLFERLDVAVTSRVQNNKRMVRFCGDGEAGAWKLDIPVPQTAMSRAFLMPRGWGIGHLLILELGGELLAISPYAPNGEPKPVLVWSRDVVEGNQLSSPQILKGVPGFRPAEINYLDPFDRSISVTGPVRSGYLCVQTRGRLVCLDPVTGQQFWERYELPQSAVCTGDAESIFLLDTERGRIDVLRVTDGAAVASHLLPGFENPQSRENRPAILTTGPACALIQYGQNAANVIDLKTGRVSWSLPTDSRHLFRADQSTIGYLSVDGKLILRDLATGRRIARLTVDVPESVNEVACVRDRQHWYVTLHSIRGATVRAVRFPTLAPLNGQLIAISRTDGRFLWQRFIRDAHMPLTQNGSIPVLVLAWVEQTAPAAGRAVVETIYHLIDKRTGETILEDRATGNNSSFLIEPDPSRRRVEIQTNHRTFRIDFTAADENR